MRWLVFLVVWWLGLQVAVKYGSIWDSRAHPTHGASVVLPGGQKVEGALQRNWTDGWTLTSENGSQYVFSKFESMAFTPPSVSQEPTTWWRMALLFALNTVLAILIAFYRPQFKME